MFVKGLIIHEVIAGHTWADAMIQALEFAQEHPLRFIVTALPALGLGIALYVVYRIFLGGPIGSHKKAYEDARKQAKAGKRQVIRKGKGKNDEL